MSGHRVGHRASVELLRSGATIGDSIRAVLEWIPRDGERTPGSAILAEAMVKATRDPAFRTWTASASRRFRSLILERLRVAGAAGELDPELDPEATAMLLAAALDGLLVHRLVDPTLEVVQAAEPLDAMLGRPGAAPSGH